MSSSAMEQAHRYQRWDGELTRGRWTWWTIVTKGIDLALNQRKTKLLAMTVWVLALGICIVVYILSQIEVLAGTSEAKEMTDFVRVMLGVDLSQVSRIEEFREVLWRALYFVVMRVELLWVLIIVARVGPPLIAQDLKYNALPIYFSKPVTPLTYITGKWCIVAAFIALVTIVPNLVSLVAAILITGGLQSWTQHAHLALDLLLAGALLSAFGGAVVLALSSLSADHRYVTVGWIAICVLPLIAQTILVETLPPEATTRWLGCVSLRDNFATIIDWLLGIRTTLESSDLPTDAFQEALHRPVQLSCAVTVTAGWIALALLITYRRIVQFSKSAANI